MGTGKYPQENKFDDIVTEYGAGENNAFTDSGDTNYYFTSSVYGFFKVFDVFSRFFIDPLLKEDSLDREINAIDSEWVNDIHEADWKPYMMMKNLSKTDHPFSNFDSGNKEYLGQKDDF